MHSSLSYLYVGTNWHFFRQSMLSQQHCFVTQIPTPIEVRDIPFYHEAVRPLHTQPTNIFFSVKYMINLVEKIAKYQEVVVDMKKTKCK